MKLLQYTIYGGDTYLTGLEREHDKTLKYVFSDLESGTLRFNGSLYPLAHGKCEIKLTGIKDGNYTPELITGARRLTLDTLTVRASTAALCCPEKNLVRLSERLIELMKRQDSSDEAITQLRNAVFGKKIF